MSVKLVLILVAIAFAWALMTLLVLLIFMLPDCHGNVRCVEQKDFVHPIILGFAVMSYGLVATLVIRSGEGR